MHLKFVLRDQRVFDLLKKASKVILEVTSEEICISKFPWEAKIILAEEQVELLEFLLLACGVKQTWNLKISRVCSKVRHQKL